MSSALEFADAYDIIIVGAGAAGCVLANRLSIDPSIQVLLLEAGNDYNHDIKVRTPLRTSPLLGNPQYDWCFKTEPQCNLENRIIRHPRGRLLGGSTAINSHSLVYPSRKYHDNWARYGNPNWTWDGIKDYYDKFQSVQEPNSAVANALKIAKQPTPTSGPISASYPAEAHILQKAWTAAFNSFDYDPEDGRNGVGGMSIANAIDKRLGERSHASLAYLAPIKHRQNLKIVTEALVSNILLEHDGTRTVARGVRFFRNANTYSIKATKEVILCAGAFGSPQILELSGIGSPSVFESHGIVPVLDLGGVGENLQDHLNYGPSVEVNQNIQTLDRLSQDPSYAQAIEEKYANEKAGPLSEGAVYVIAYHPLQMFNTEKEDIELGELLKEIPATSPAAALQYEFIKEAILSPTEASATVFQPHTQRYTSPSSRAPGNFMTTIAMLSHPFSRGNVHITSKDPAVHPKIDFQYLSHPLDLEILGRHAIQIERILDLSPIAEHVRENGTRLPSEFPQKLESIDHAKQILSKYAATNYHPCGTCAMMSRELGGVVDENLKVHGTANLRVCDASIFPVIPRGNILTTVYAAAEKGADIILASLGSSDA